MKLRLNSSQKSDVYRITIVLFILAVAESFGAQDSRRPLFNGKDTDGWQQVGPRAFVVKDGMMKTEGGRGMNRRRSTMLLETKQVELAESLRFECQEFFVNCAAPEP